MEKIVAKFKFSLSFNIDIVHSVVSITCCDCCVTPAEVVVYLYSRGLQVRLVARWGGESLFVLTMTDWPENRGFFMIAPHCGINYVGGFYVRNYHKDICNPPLYVRPIFSLGWCVLNCTFFGNWITEVTCVPWLFCNPIC